MEKIKAGTIIDLGDTKMVVIEKVESEFMQILVLNNLRLLPNLFENENDIYKWLKNEFGLNEAMIRNDMYIQAQLYN